MSFWSFHDYCLITPQNLIKPCSVQLILDWVTKFEYPENTIEKVVFSKFEARILADRTCHYRYFRSLVVYSDHLFLLGNQRDEGFMSLGDF